MKEPDGTKNLEEMSGTELDKYLEEITAHLPPKKPWQVYPQDNKWAQELVRIKCHIVERVKEVILSQKDIIEIVRGKTGIVNGITIDGISINSNPTEDNVLIVNFYN